MDIITFTSEIRELIKRAQVQIAAEKLLAVCKKGSYQYQLINNCLDRIEKLKKEEIHYFSNGQYMEGKIREDNTIAWNQITFALLNVLDKLSPDELESN